jgi:hypothetical protein
MMVPLVLLGCYPGGPNDIEDVGMVITQHDAAFNFKQLNTFSLANEVVDITGNLTEGQLPDFLDDPYSKDILDAIRQNMTAYGWVEVDKSANPDVIILPSVLTAPGYDWWFDALYWRWYYPFEVAGWTYTYGLYGGSFKTGSVIILASYPDGVTADDNVPVLWAGLCNGLVEGSTSSISARIKTGVDKAFHQSPYLQQ